MKKDLHPKYFEKAAVHCACGNKFTVGSTKEVIDTEVCNKCHPFYTKQEKVMDTLGRVQKFKDRLSKKSATPKKDKGAKRTISPDIEENKQDGQKAKTKEVKEEAK